MSLVTSTPQQICNHPLNTSKSKFLYSFSKASKDNLVKKSVCSTAFYDVPEARATRTTGFGYSTKYDFTKAASNNPPPNAYHVPSVFDPSTKKKGYSFGLSREAMAATGGQTVGEKKSPGPAAYDVRELNKSSISFSFRPRTTIEPLSSPKFVPGPGTYPTLQTISPSGKYYISKFKNSGATLISPARSRRFIDLKSDQPGPGTYELNASTISPNGSYFLSKFRSSLCRTFGKNNRKNQSVSTFVGTPGPGNYRLPSDFGYYEAKTKATDKTLSPTRVTQEETKE